MCAPHSLASRITHAYLPAPGKTLLLIGQDIDSTNGYLERVDPFPAGFMVYTSANTAAGLTQKINYGAGPCCADHYTKDPNNANTVIQLGIYLVDQLETIVAGYQDKEIEKIGNWIKAANRPVYVRIGYEFDGPWNHYEPKCYVNAYRYIADRFGMLGITNASYIWSSAAVPAFRDYPINEWYPGDTYVDWVGLSVFRQFDGTLGSEADLERVCAYAYSKSLPIGIVESAPCGSLGGITERNWEWWFAKLFRFIEEHDIRMLCYINADWDTQPMWKNQGWGDSRIERNAAITEKWLNAINAPRYLRSSPDLFGALGFIPVSTP